MNTTSRPLIARPLRRVLALLPCALALAGCLGKPEIEDRWTRVDLLGTNLVANQVIAPGSAESVSVSTTITYRHIVTGFLVTELRVSGTMSAADVALNANAPRERMALDIDQLLRNSVTAGRATRAITGWDHLIQRVDLTFAGAVPTALDTTVAPGGTPLGVFLLCYLGSGDEVRRADGTDTLIVTPFDSRQYEILPVGLELSVPGSGNH